MDKLEKYYEKFNEENRLLTRHGQVEFETSLKYIKMNLKGCKSPKIVDIGAGTGRYSVELFDEGFDVTAVEPVKKNIEVLRSKHTGVKTFQGNALNLDMFEDNLFDITILFGPLYHLFYASDKLKALNEAIRVTKKGGIIFVAYYMNDYAVLTHGFRDNNIFQSINNGKLDKSFHTQTSAEDLYSMVTIEDILSLDKSLNANHIKFFAPDGPSDYMRPILNKMDEKTFDLFKQYNFSICEREDLLGASSHIVDILKKI